MGTIKPGIGMIYIYVANYCNGGTKPTRQRSALVIPQDSFYSVNQLISPQLPVHVVDKIESIKSH